ncbi:MAG: ATP-binding cassette domain-containing protein, partial [Flammeovirgaceae bacterium]
MIIKVRNLGLTYQDHETKVEAVKKLNLVFPNKGLIGVLGSSGSGKTSLLYLLSGIRQPTSGEVDFDNLIADFDFKDVNQLRRSKMGFVFQQHFLINYLTVLENILVGLP